MIDLNQIIGQPYSLPSTPPMTFDCFSLVEFVRRELFQLPTPIPYAVESLFRTDIHKVVLAVMSTGAWVKVANPRLGDVVHMEANHVGVLVDGGYVIHAWRSNNRGSVVMTSDRINRRLFSMLGYLRLRDA